MPNESKIINLKDYKVPAHLIPTKYVEFHLDKKETVVKSKQHFQANPASKEDTSKLVLDYGDNGKLKIKSIKIDGTELKEDKDFIVKDGSITFLIKVPADFSLEIENTISPEANTKCKGVYLSDGAITTHCEAQGLRHIFPTIDEPHILSKWTVKVIGDKKELPVLLSNGNPDGAGDLPDGKHWAQWNDPYPKPTYLFAMVAGQLKRLTKPYRTKSGKEITLEVYADDATIDRCKIALENLTESMIWDEETFDRECDLDTYKIVSMRSFNEGAMENKGLNIFNSAYILADSKTSTDDDFEGVRDTIAHEYFHNWTGNRITCRDWFQLCLKEGLTTFREHMFAEDHSGITARIKVVNYLRTGQFLEDGGPKAHPPQLNSYESINNFYTGTVYKKGSEIYRMLQTYLGREQFKAGMNNYFKRFDGQAVTIEDFIDAHEESANQGIPKSDSRYRDLKPFLRWFKQAGTPVLDITDSYDEKTQTYTLHCKQMTPSTPGQDSKSKLPLPIPIKLGLLDSNGNNYTLSPNNKDKSSQVLLMDQAEQEFKFKLPFKPTPSLLRGFSAIVKLNYQYSDQQLAMMMTHDDDLFNRWNANREYQKNVMKKLIKLYQENKFEDFVRGVGEFTANFGKILATKFDDLEVQSLMLQTPRVLELFADKIDVDTYVAVSKYISLQIGRTLKPQLLEKYQEFAKNNVISEKFDKEQSARRGLKNLCLSYLVKSRDEKMVNLAHKQFEATLGVHMTDNMAALEILNQTSARQAPLDAFKNQWKNDPNVMDKWLELQGNTNQADVLEKIKALLNDKDLFNIEIPNNIYNLLFGFVRNMEFFHAANGSGYQFMGDMVLQLDPINSDVASTLANTLVNWERYDGNRATLMKKQLERLYNHPGISTEVLEIARKGLGISGVPAAKVEMGLFKSNTGEKAAESKEEKSLQPVATLH